LVDVKSEWKAARASGRRSWVYIAATANFNLLVNYSIWQEKLGKIIDEAWTADAALTGAGPARLVQHEQTGCPNPQFLPQAHACRAI